MVTPVGGDLREGTTWYLIGGSALPPAATLIFDADTLSGKAPVNSYSAPYTATSTGDLEIGEIISTKMAGSEADMATETAFFETLGQVDGYTAVDGGELYLFDGDLQTLTFSTTPSPLPSLVEDVVGMTEAEAQAAVEEAGFTFRVISRDGEGLPATADYRTDRISATVVDGTVTEASIG